ncbi:ribonuclease M5 [Limosilactobacillus sp.]|uniref:ribonuclease M5 n=1 Tax=Limosilactobacillus sp. TaxID=2773925 RepID=UPI00345F1557
MKKIKEVIVVEGKDDTKQIQKAVNADTYETRGSALSAVDLKRLKKLQQRRGLIVFTDPDFNGERLRKMISQAVPGVKHAFIRRDQGVPTEAHGSLGVEHASPETIRQALANVYTEETKTEKPLFTYGDLARADLVNGPTSRRRRERLGQILGIGYGNGKQFLHRLNLFRVSRDDFTRALAQIDGEDQHD